ncbi:MAG: rhodanese-like domain-containing protein, partial [Rhodospirillales bacterium]|nr:rhodanese-like domain-containing protein [Rhodospirillales bacterium]
KAFGEYIEHRFQTPAIGPEELKAMLGRGEPVVILDSRPYDEYHRMTIPRSIDVPGAELVYRVHDLLPDTDALVVVNCAGRTRSIIGCQSLRNAGIPNRVAALTNGTMGWEISGFGCERGATRVAAPPSARGYAMAVAAADRIAKRFGVEFVGGETVRAWQHDTAHTLFLLDVRTREEFEAGRIAGSRHAPGGQLVQATDEYIGVRNARNVLIDSAGVRSVLTAAWLNQMGLKDVYVLKPEGDDGFAGWATERGQRRPARLGFSRWPTLQAGEVERMLGRDEAAVIDLSSSLSFRNGHVPGAWWGVRSRLEEAYATLPAVQRLVLTSPDGVLAHYAAPEAAELWPSSSIRVLEGGNSSWLDAALRFETGTDRSTTTLDDVWYRPYQRAEDYERHARDYLSWEVALLEQIKRDPTVEFRDYS